MCHFVGDSILLVEEEIENMLFYRRWKRIFFLFGENTKLIIDNLFVENAKYITCFWSEYQVN